MISRRAVLVVLLAATLGCSTGELNCGSPPDLTGAWTYTGTQVSPPASITGSMNLTHPGTCLVGGNISLTVDDGSGTPQVLTGPVAGIWIDEHNLELNAEFGDERSHAATVVADTMSGDWSQPGAGGGASGTFKAVKN